MIHALFYVTTYVAMHETVLCVKQSSFFTGRSGIVKCCKEVLQWQMLCFCKSLLSESVSRSCLLGPSVAFLNNFIKVYAWLMYKLIWLVNLKIDVDLHCNYLITWWFLHPFCTIFVWISMQISEAVDSPMKHETSVRCHWLGAWNSLLPSKPLPEPWFNAPFNEKPPPAGVSRNRITGQYFESLVHIRETTQY